MGKKKTKPRSRPQSITSKLCKDGKVTTKRPKQSKLFKCDLCSKEFTDKYYMISHQNVHTSDTPFSCPQCSYRGKTKKYLARHIKQVHKELTKDNKCNVCGKFFLHPSNLKVHAMIHTGEKPHSCNVCGKTFRVTYSLNTHMHIHTNEKPFQCSFCDYACRDSSTLRKHQNKHMGMERIYECKICTKGYKNRAALKIHISETHLDVDMRRFPCGQCDRSFKTNGHRQMHINSIHARALVCNCPICGRRLLNKHNLSAHMRTHMRERPFTCTHEGCTLAFKNKNSLTKHTVIHNPSQHFPCKYCERKFARKTHVQRHERVMHEERTRRVECHYCGSKFYSKNYLLKHIQTKHVYKQKFKYICDICGLITHNKPSIVMHLKYGHANDHDMQCKICDNKIIYKRHIYLKLHYWKTHNIKYKITKKATHTKATKEKHEKSTVEIKVETIEADSYEEMQLMDVHKQESGDEANDFESLDYSKRVLSEDIAESVLRGRSQDKEVDFDDFFIRNVFAKQETSVEDESKNDGVDVEQNQCVKRRIQHILNRTKKLEEAKVLREKRKHEEKIKRDREREETKLKREKERQEITELRRVREMYNERMKASVAKGKRKKEQVKIMYFKKKPENYKKKETVAEEIDDENPGNSRQSSENDDKKHVNLIAAEYNGDNFKDSANDEKNEILSDNVNSASTETVDHSSEPIEENRELHEANTEINEDSTVLDEYNTEINEDSTVLDEDNTEMNEDGTALDEDNTQMNEDNTALDKDNTEMNEDSTVLDEDNTEMNEDSTVLDEDNTEMNEDSTVLDKDNTEINEDNAVLGEDYTGINEDSTVLGGENTGLEEENMIPTEKNIELYEVNIGLNGVNMVLNEDNTELKSSKQDNTYEKNDKSNSSDFETYEGSSNEDKENPINNNDDDDDTLDQPLLERQVKVNRNKLKSKLNKNDDVDSSDNKDTSDSDEDMKESGETKKMEFKTYQCYVCFKLYQKKQQLIDHCQEHFDICNERTLTKCPICNHVSFKSLAEHMKRKHDVTIKVPFNKIKDRKTTDGSRYCYDVDGTIVEVIPSVKILNKTASDEIDKKRRDINNRSVAKTKLVKKGDEWIVEKEAIDIEYDEIPELTDIELHKCKVTENDVDRLGQLSHLAKKKGLKMMFPCFECEKICQNFSALKLHKRRHEDNPKPFKPKVYKRSAKPEVKTKIKLNTANRTAFPKPILNKHKCDTKLKEFYESNIRGGDIEFWQFLKIFNKMDREKVNDFKDLEERTDFGNHLDYYKDVEKKYDEMGNADEIAKDDDIENGDETENDDEVENEDEPENVDKIENHKEENDDEIDDNVMENNNEEDEMENEDKVENANEIDDNVMDNEVENEDEMENNNEVENEMENDDDMANDDESGNADQEIYDDSVNIPITRK